MVAAQCCLYSIARYLGYSIYTLCSIFGTSPLCLVNWFLLCFFETYMVNWQIINDCFIKKIYNHNTNEHCCQKNKCVLGGEYRYFSQLTNGFLTVACLVFITVYTKWITLKGIYFVKLWQSYNGLCLDTENIYRT